MKKLPVGLQSISKVLGEVNLYVDKTHFIKRILDDAGYYFISRPRRFGKSLFINTLAEVLKGNKELFKECAIYESDYNWEGYPVVSLDFAQIPNSSKEALEAGMIEILQDIAKLHGVTVAGASSQTHLKRLVTELSGKNRVAVLIDEYDQPIISNLKNPKVAEENRDLLKSFYSTLKSLDANIKLTFVTGVSKFSQVSLFSGLNNLKDITMDPRFADIMGYTEEEIHSYFQPHAKKVAEEMGVGVDDVFALAKEWYNGYRFSKKETAVYNPFSTLCFMDRREIGSYWYSTGTPSFLIDEVKKHPQSVAPLSGASATENQLMNISHFDKIDIVALMYQTGYLTVQGYNEKIRRYQVGFPNQEVEEAFLETLITNFSPITPTLASKCQEFLESRDLSSFFGEIKTMLASFPYQLFVKATEATYQSILLGMLKGMEFEAEAEELTNIGRVDLTIETPKTTFLFELKLDSSKDGALTQIHDKKYYEKYLRKEKELALVGLIFSSKTRSISDWKGEILSPSGGRIKDL